jgi:1,4-dihydroxy-2-naphthoyl-CoA synthase
MTEPVRLVPKPTIDEEIRAGVIDLLRDALADAEAGNVTGVIILTSETDGMWGHRSSASLSIREEIGALEFYKHDRIVRTRTIE